MKSIYLCGRAGSGKTSCAEYLIKKGYLAANFAFQVYDIAYNYFNMDRTIKDRKLLQIIGTDIARKRISHDFWVNRFLDDIDIVELTREELRFPKVNFVNSDTRFRNEHEELKKRGWLGIYLDVSDEIRIKRLQSRDNTAQIETLNHSSETALDEFKDELIWVDANGSLQEMFDNLEVAINRPFIIKQSDDDWNYRNTFGQKR